MKKLSAVLSLILCLCILSACVGTPVIYHKDCDCPTEGTDETKPSSPDIPPAEGALKTGIAIVTDIGDSADASADKDGEGKYDVTVVAVLVDESGIIRDCIIDGISASVKFDGKGQISSDTEAAPQTKNELGDKYGMVSYGGAKYEWYKQAAALADFAVGKTANELRDGAIDETGKAPADSDLASSATIYLAGYVSAIEKAVKDAAHLGAESGDSLSLAIVSAIDGSKSAEGEKDGTAQLDVTSAVTTVKDGVITSCVFDSVQAKVSFDAVGKVTSDLEAPVQTKNELGDKYGMVAYGGAVAEWNEQAASFAKYVTGKTPSEVEGIAVDEKLAPTDADISSSVTISVGAFLSLILKAAK